MVKFRKIPLFGDHPPTVGEEATELKMKIKNDTLKNSGRMLKTQAIYQVRYNSKLCLCTDKKGNFQNMFF